MWVKALKDLPNRVKTGERFEVPDHQGQILMNAKVVKADPAVPAKDAPREGDEPEEDEAKRESTPAATVTRRSPNYRRRDLQAEGETSE
jgi:hypothetical protein